MCLPKLPKVFPAKAPVQPQPRPLNEQTSSVTAEDVMKVHYLIECCLAQHLSLEETCSALEKLGVGELFTRIVWAKLEDQNPSFFKDYSLHNSQQTQNSTKGGRSLVAA